MQPSSATFTFTVGQFNILAKQLASPEHFPYVKTDNLEWYKRRERLLQNIENLTTVDGNHIDILCMEELCEYWEFFKDTLGSDRFGFNSVYLKRPSITVSSWSGQIKTDGCGIFYSKEKFKLLHHHSVNFADEHDRVGLVILLECIGPHSGAGYLIVANTHLYWNIKSIEVQLDELKQVKTAIEDLMDFVNKENQIDVDSIPIILAGDFNNIPSSDIYKYVMNDLFPKKKMRSSFACYKKENHLPESKDIDSIPICGTFEPNFTSVTYKRAYTIDYIFYSAELLTLSSVSKISDEEELRQEDGPSGWQDKLEGFNFVSGNNYNGIPNSKWGSDHVPICASFQIIQKNIQ